MDRALRILLAEDNPGDVFLVKESLNRHLLHYELTAANDGERAWKLVEMAEASPDGSFDIVILDLNLPIRPGLEILSRIRSSPSAVSRSLVVIVTSSYSTPDRTAATNGGADYYFCKPSNLDAFLQLGSIIKQLWAARTLRDAKTRDKTARKGTTV